MFKKIYGGVLCAFLFAAIMSQAALAANNVSDINVDVGIYDDGSAYITQTWNCDFSEGTECYIPIENLGEMSISNFMVSDENGPYTYVEDWNINAGFEEKAGKYGIVKTDKGYELCWGIGEYGQRRYAIEYKIDKLVGGYTDFDGFNFQFINPGMGTLPTNVTVKITMQNGITLDENNCGIWAFGFGGKIEFQDGNVAAYTEKALSSDTDSVIIMLQLNKGLITPARVLDESFETVKTRAFEGSDYDSGSNSDSTSGEESSPADMVVGFVIMALPILAIIVFLVLKNRKKKKKILELYNNADYYREAPISGNIEATYVLAEDFGQASDEGNIIGAAFLQLINAGCLEPLTERTVGFFGKEKESISLRLVHPPELDGFTAGMLYDLLVSASGSDQILQERELEKYCQKHYEAMTKIIEAAKQYGRDTLVRMNSYDASKAAKPLGLSENGITLLQSIMGFKKYLLEFSLIGERSIAESVIWQDYLTFAALLGIADKAIEQFEKVYPTVTQYSENAHYYYFIAYRYRHASYDTAQAARSSGSGGASSFGGGGGFSGGGGGGGTR